MQLFSGQQMDREAMCACCGFSLDLFAQLQFRGHVALAYGVPVPSIANVFLPIDAVGMRLNGEIGARIGRDYATAIVLNFFDHWADAVGRTEAGDPRCMFFCVAMRRARGKSEPEFFISSGTEQEIMADLDGIPIDTAVTASITGIIADIRIRAKAVGLSLNQRFFPAPDDPSYRELIDDVKRQRFEALKRYRDGKQYKLHLKRHKPIGRAARAAERTQ